MSANIAPKEYRLSDKEAKLLTLLLESRTKGQRYKEMKDKMQPLSDPSLSKILEKLQRRKLIQRGEKRRYSITRLGGILLFSLESRQLTRDEMRTKRSRMRKLMWDEVRRVHQQVLELWMPEFDATSKLLFTASGGPEFVMIGAVTNRQGKEVLMLRTLNLEELKGLGYSVEPFQPLEEDRALGSASGSSVGD